MRRSVLAIATVMFLSAMFMPMAFSMSDTDRGFVTGMDIGLADLESAVDDFASGSEISGGYDLTADTELTASDVVALPALAEGRTFTINGNIRYVIYTDTDDPASMFTVDEDNKGTYVFKDIVLTTDPGISQSVMAIEDKGTGSILMTGSTFESFTAVYAVSTSSSVVTVTDSSFIDNAGALTILSESAVTVENCFFNDSGAYSPIIGNAGYEISLTVADCTFFGIEQWGAINLIAETENNGNDVSVKRCLFIADESMGSIAISISGQFSGTVDIEECMFSEMTSYWQYGLICIWSESSAGLDISMRGTTFDSCTSATGQMITFESGSGGNGINATIENSTFWNNTSGGTLEPSAFLHLVNTAAYIINSTFHNNMFSDGSDALPAAVHMDEHSSTVSVNSIYSYKTDGIDTDDGILGDVFSSFGDIFEYTGALFASEDLDYTGITIGFLGDAEMKVPIIIPDSGEGPTADGSGWSQDKVDEAGLNITLPERDQTRNDRIGRPDAGSVTAASALFYAEGGNWSQEVASEPYPNHYFSDPYRMASVSGSDGNIAAPYDSDLFRDDMLLMGWSSSQSSKYPDAGMEFEYGQPTTGFTVDGIYFAKWGYKAVFFPSATSDDVTVAIVADGDTLKFPSLGTVDGMRVAYWSTDIDGNDRWDQEMKISGHMELYAQWESVPADDLDAGVIAAVAVTGAVASVGALALGFAPTGSSQSAASMADAGLASTDGQERNRRSVTFYPRNGSSPWTKFVMSGRVMTPVPSDPVHPEGKRFVGWATSRKGGEFFNILTPITTNMVLYAIYDD